jgi:c-di-GMP-binding flagellar brake protein YcgR
MDESPRADDGDLDAGSERFRVDSRLEIASILATLVERGVLVSVTFGRDVVNTVLLAVDAAAGEIVFDAGQSAEVNARLEAASRVAFDTSLERIRIRFRGGAVTPRTWQGAPAFACAMPATLVRLQRRDYFRAHVPLASSLRCAVRTAGADGTPPASLTLRVLDVSVTGIALADAPTGFAPAPGTRLDGARLALATGSLDVDLEVMYCRAPAPGSASGAPLRIGCRFVDLPPRGQALIQRCINALERERRSRT